MSEDPLVTLRLFADLRQAALKLIPLDTPNAAGACSDRAPASDTQGAR